MKKFLVFIIVCFTTFHLFAQTIVSSSALEDTYVSLNGGAFGWLKPQKHGHDNFVESLRGSASIRVGKFITPKVGVEIDGDFGMGNYSTFFSHSNVSVNGMFNVNNILHGYKGNPDILEVVPFVGIGWIHTFGDFVSNNLSGKSGVQLNWNFDKNKAWQFNIRPSITYILTNNKFSSNTNCQFTSNRAFTTLEIGVTYKFKNKKKTHNFVICPKVFTQEDMDSVIEELTKTQRLLVQSHKVNEKCVHKLKHAMHTIESLSAERDSLLSREMVVTTITKTAVGFTIGKSELLPTSKATLLTFIETVNNNDSKIVLTGYSDAETGSRKWNKHLSQLRAETIKEFLVENGIEESRIEINAKGSDEQLFNENNVNRVVIINVD